MTNAPGDRDRIPTRFGDDAAVSGIAMPINAGTLLENIGVGDRHCHSAVGLRETIT